jgi:hypothetical protein
VKTSITSGRNQMVMLAFSNQNNTHHVDKLVSLLGRLVDQFIIWYPY